MGHLHFLYETQSVYTAPSERLTHSLSCTTYRNQ